MTRSVLVEKRTSLRRWLVIPVLALAGLEQVGCGESSDPADNCTEGQRRCALTVAQVCKSGVWTDDSDCSLVAGSTCKQGTCSTPDCTTEGPRCKAGTQVVQSCSQGAWKDGEDCAQSGKACSQGECLAVNECTTEGPRCKAGTQVIEICQAQKWTDGADCAKDGKVCQVGVCLNPSTKLADSVYDFAVSATNLYVVNRSPTTTKPQLILCPLTGCGDNPTVLSTWMFSDFDFYGIEVVGDKVAWMEKRSLVSPIIDYVIRRANLDGTQVEDVVVLPGGAKFLSTLASSGQDVFFGMDDPLSPQVAAVDVVSDEKAITKVAGIDVEAIWSGWIFADAAFLAFVQPKISGVPISIKNLASAEITKLGSAKSLAMFGLTMVGENVFWSESFSTPKVLYGCSLASGCAAGTAVRDKILGPIASDGARLFFAYQVADGEIFPGAIVSCDVESALAGTCVPKLEAKADSLDWMVINRRIRVTPTAIYGINQNSQLWMIER